LAPPLVHFRDPRGRARYTPEYRDAASEALVVLSPRERLTQLLGSLLVAGGVAAAACLPLASFTGQFAPPEQYAWLVAVSALGAWSLLIVGKLWEGADGEPLVRRIVLLFLGLALGAMAWQTDAALMLDSRLALVSGNPIHEWDLVRTMYDHAGKPLAAAYLAYYGAVFAVPAWWRQSDPRRSARVSLFATMWVGLVAWLANLVWPFPQPMGIFSVVVMSLAVQLSATWQGHGRVRR
jgi:hypothetical protein